MEQMNLDWMSNDKALMETLSGIASSNGGLVSEATTVQADNILDFLLQPAETGVTISNAASNTLSDLSQPSQSPPAAQPLFQELNYSTTPLDQTAQANANNAISSNTNSSMNESLEQSVSVVQNDGTFVNVTPAKTGSNAKSKAARKRTKFKEPIFVTESPESYRNRKKTHSSSGDDNSEDEITASDANVSTSALKNMTPKERRQLRNKLSARNFRVRRKEYMSQLEERVDKQNEIISKLKKENEDLRKVNAELMKQLLLKPAATPPALSLDEAVYSSSTTSGSEGHQSPSSNSPPYPLAFNNLHDFTLVNQPQQQLQFPSQAQGQQPQTEPTPALDLFLPPPQLNHPESLFFLHHAAMPDWDLPRILTDKPNVSEQEQREREIAQRLMRDYPLLAPALMSLVLHHVISMEYVAELAKEFSNGLEAELMKKSDDDQDTLLGDDVDDLKAQLDSLTIGGDDRRSSIRRTSSLLTKEPQQQQKLETKKAIKNGEEADSSTTKKEEETERLSEADLVRKMLTEHFQYYVLLRATGMSHDEIMDRNRPCLLGDQSHCKKNSVKLSKLKKLGGGSKQDNCTSKSNLQTIQSFSRVAAELLKKPQRMTHVREVIRKEVRSRQTTNKQSALPKNSIAFSSDSLRIAQ